MARDPIRIELTPEQREQIKKAAGANVEALEVSTEEPGTEQLEERVAPALPTISIKVKGTFVF